MSLFHDVCVAQVDYLVKQLLYLENEFRCPYLAKKTSRPYGGFVAEEARSKDSGGSMVRA